MYFPKWYLIISNISVNFISCSHTLYKDLHSRSDPTCESNLSCISPFGLYNENKGLSIVNNGSWLTAYKIIILPMCFKLSSAPGVTQIFNPNFIDSPDEERVSFSPSPLRFRPSLVMFM